MSTMHVYPREEALEALVEATDRHEGKRKPVVWVCTCGCDVAMLFRRTARGLAFTLQAWPPGVEPHVTFFETEDEVAAYVNVVVTGMRKGSLIDEEGLARIASFEKTVWAAWADN